MNNTLKKILPITLLIWPYLCILPFWAGSINESLYSPGIGIYAALTVVVYVMNIINACLYKGEDAYYRLAFWGMLMKIIHIPFYLIVFLLGILFLLASVVPALVFVTPFMILMLVAIDLFLMITSSLYGMNALIRACKRRLVSKIYTVVQIILHCFFVTDVISAVMVYFKLRKALVNKQK